MTRHFVGRVNGFIEISQLVAASDYNSFTIPYVLEFTILNTNSFHSAMSTTL